MERVTEEEEQEKKKEALLRRQRKRRVRAVNRLMLERGLRDLLPLSDSDGADAEAEDGGPETKEQKVEVAVGVVEPSTGGFDSDWRRLHEEHFDAAHKRLARTLGLSEEQLLGVKEAVLGVQMQGQVYHGAPLCPSRLPLVSDEHREVADLIRTLQQSGLGS